MSEQPEIPVSTTDATTLSDDERRKVRELFGTCTVESFRLGEVLLDSLGANPADIAAIFHHGLLRQIVSSCNTTVWEETHHVLNRCGQQSHFSALLVLYLVNRWRNSSGSDKLWWWMRSWPSHDLKTMLASHDRSEWSGCHGFDQDQSPWADLGFITALDGDLADAIARFKGDVRLDGLAHLEPEQAMTLAGHEGWLYLNGLTAVTDAVADALVKHESHIFLEGLTSLTHAGLAEKLSAKPIVYLDELITVSPEAAATLARSGKKIVARSLREPLRTIKVQ